MKKLTSEAFGRAASFMRDHARPLEARLFEFHFEGGSSEAVLSELTKFQNADGGFGHGLEADMRAPESSALATVTALDILRRVNAAEINPLVRGAIKYLLDTYDPETRVWRIVPAGSDASPHAPWWNQSTLEKVFDNFLTNPRSRIISHLYHYPGLSDAGFRRQLLDVLMAHFRTLGDKSNGDALLGLGGLYETAGVPPDVREEMGARMMSLVAASVETDPAKWGEYCLKPLWVAPTPASPFYAPLRAAIDANLDYEIDHQSPDGAWNPFWEWGGVYPDDWEKAKTEWKGVLTCNTLLALRSFDRLEA